MNGGRRTVAVAFSGGRDSLALLHAATRAAALLGLEVVALHVPPEGAEDPTVKVVAVDRVPVAGTVS